MDLINHDPRSKFWVLCVIRIIIFMSIASAETFDVEIRGPVLQQNFIETRTLNNSSQFESRRSGTEKIQEDEKFWYDNLPLPPIAVANSESSLDGACKRHLHIYLQHLRNGTLWATQMFDASVKVPFSILDGQTWQLGNFDECYRLRTNLSNDDGKVESVQGKYCLVEYKFRRKNPSTNKIPRLDLDFELQGSIWDAIEDKEDFRRMKRNILRLAICVPASCRAGDIQSALQESFDRFAKKYDLVIGIKIEAGSCQTSGEERQFTVEAKIYCSILFVILVLVVSSSYYNRSANKIDIDMGRLGLRQLLLCFSPQSNIRKLFEVNHTHRGLDILHFHRVFFLTLIMAGHGWLRYYVNPVRNKNYLEQAMRHPLLIIIFNGTIMVDGFLAVGGLLTSYGLLEYLEKTNRTNFSTLISFRFLRLTPLYAIIVFFYAYVFPLLGSGPLWPSMIIAQADHCASTWASNLFYLNNYLTSDQLCIFQSWYLAVDFHCYVLAIGLIHVFRKLSRRIGYLFLILVTIISILIPFYLTYSRHLPPAFLPLPRTLTNLTVDKLFRNHYQKTHLRMSGYLVGVIAGALLYDYQNVSWRIPKRYSKILFILCFTSLVFGSWILAYPYMDPSTKQSRLWMGLYAGLHRAFFAAGICSVVLIISMSEGLDQLYNFLTAGWIQPFSRLTYGVFLSHNIIQSYHMGSVRGERIMSPFMMICHLIPDLILAYLLAFIIVIGIEFPFRRMEKYIIHEKLSNPPKEINKKSNPEVKGKKMI